MATKQIASYSLLIYGGETGYVNHRAQIQLRDTSGQPIAWVRFIPPGVPFPADSEQDGIIRMHLPDTMFQSVLDVLRQERPLFIHFAQGRGFLSSAIEPVGEEEG
jgi:hypothetical protein